MIKRKEVVSFTRRKNKQDGCVVLITKENGERRKEFLFGAAGANVKCPGTYDIVYSKNRTSFPLLVEAKLVKKSAADA